MSESPVLIWSSLPDFPSRLNDCLKGSYAFTSVGSLEEAQSVLEQTEPSVFLVSSQQLTECGEELMRMAYQTRPRLPIALIESTTSSNCYWLLQMYGLSAAIPHSLSFSPRHIEIFFQHLTAATPGFALDPYFGSDQQIVRHRLQAPSMRNEILEAIMSDFAEVDYVSSHDLQLIFEEILNNAIFHALRPREAQAMKAGESLADVPFGPNEEIRVEWSVSPSSSALAITDNQGLLSQQDVWDRFFRQTSLTGLLDTDGRGLFLAHLLSRQVMVTISPGARTQIAVFFSPEPPENEKLISVRSI